MAGLKAQGARRADPLSSWSELNARLMEMGEAEVAKLLGRERRGAARPTFVARLYARFSKLRGERERRELMGGSAG